MKKIISVKKESGSVRGYDKSQKIISGLEMIEKLDADVLIETTASNYNDAEPGMSHIICHEKGFTCNFC